MIKPRIPHRPPSSSPHASRDVRKLILIKPGPADAHQQPNGYQLDENEEKNVINADWLICPYDTTNGRSVIREVSNGNGAQHKNRAIL